jgi:hypothetical protein
MQRLIVCFGSVAALVMGCGQVKEAPGTERAAAAMNSQLVPQGQAAGWFEDTPVIGVMSADEAAAKLKELGEPAIDSLTLGPNVAAENAKPWQHTSHAFGHLPLGQAGAPSPVSISHAGQIAADQTLKGARITIRLDRLRVADYPGDGLHYILFDFYAQNQVAGNTEHLHFNQTYRVQEGQGAGIIGYPVFVGLNVGQEGVAFKGFTVNVKNGGDEKLLSVLESDVFRSGMKLINSTNPVVPIVSNMAIGITKMIASRNRNVAVQDFFMGLDFSGVQTSARLAQGSYIVVQLPDPNQWNWSEWTFNPNTGEIARKDRPTEKIPYNYGVFSIV